MFDSITRTACVPTITDAYWGRELWKNFLTSQLAIISNQTNKPKQKQNYSYLFMMNFIQQSLRSWIQQLKFNRKMCHGSGNYKWLQTPLPPNKKMFGVTDTSEHDNCISYFFFFCLKYYIHRCKFQESDLSFVAFMNLVKTKRNIEYKIAVSKGKLRKHFKKWTLDLDASWRKSFDFFLYFSYLFMFILYLT